MNQSLHFYLNDLVRDAKQLTITTDNAKIPLDLSYSDHLDDRSSHSYYSSGFSSYGQQMADTSTSSHSSTGSISRWESEISSNSNTSNNKERNPKKPLRRLNSCSPPSSPEKESRLRDHRRRRIVECFGDDDDCCAPSSQQLCLTEATARSMGMRMPRRQVSNDGTSRKGKRRASQKPKRGVRGDTSKTKPSSSTTRRNVGEILGEAIRELGIEKEMAVAFEVSRKPLQ